MDIQVKESQELNGEIIQDLLKGKDDESTAAVSAEENCLEKKKKVKIADGQEGSRDNPEHSRSSL